MKRVTSTRPSVSPVSAGSHCIGRESLSLYRQGVTSSACQREGGRGRACVTFILHIHTHSDASHLCRRNMATCNPHCNPLSFDSDTLRQRVGLRPSTVTPAGRGSRSGPDVVRYRFAGGDCSDQVRAAGLGLTTGPAEMRRSTSRARPCQRGPAS